MRATRHAIRALVEFAQPMPERNEKGIYVNNSHRSISNPVRKGKASMEACVMYLDGRDGKMIKKKEETNLKPFVVGGMCAQKFSILQPAK